VPSGLCFLYICVSKKSNLGTDSNLVRVTLLPGIMQLRKFWKCRSSDLVPGQIPNMSSRKREYNRGWIWKRFIAAWSNFLR